LRVRSSSFQARTKELFMVTDLKKVFAKLADKS